MSASPPKELDVEPGAQSGDDAEAAMNDPHASGLYDSFEVKEQDRWLPIANGQSPIPPCDLRAKYPFCMSSVPCDWYRFLFLRRTWCRLTTHRACGANAGLVVVPLCAILSCRALLLRAPPPRHPRAKRGNMMEHLTLIFVILLQLLGS